MVTPNRHRRGGAPGRRLALSALAGLSLMVLVPGAFAAGGRDRGEAAAGVVAAGRFQPSLVNPRYSPPSASSRAARFANYLPYLSVLPDPKSHLLFTLDGGPAVQGAPSPTYAAAYRLSSLTPAAAHGTLLPGSVSASVLDARRGGLAVALSRGGAQTATTALARIVASRGVPRAAQVTPVSLGAGQVAVGLAAGPGPDLFFAVSVEFPPPIAGRPSQPVPRTAELSLVRLGHGVVWTDRLAACWLPDFGSEWQLPAPVGYVAQRRVVDLGCAAAPRNSAPTQPPIPGGVGELALTGRRGQPRPGGFLLYPIAGDTGSTSASAGVWDPGLDRMVLDVLGNGATELAVFDARHAAWVGQVTLGPVPPSGLGVDPAHGRLYVLEQGEGNGFGAGLVTTDLATTPVGQGLEYPQFALDPAPPGGGPFPHALAVDPRSGRVFLLYSRAPSFLVARDRSGYYHPPAPANPDANTVNVPEQPGKTGATFTGVAQGYGSVLRQVGGLSNLVVNFTGGGVQELGSDRESDASYLNTLSLGQAGTNATAIAAQADPTTEQAAPGGWPFQPASCNSSDPKRHRGSWSSDGARLNCAKDAVTANVSFGSSSASYVPARSGKATPPASGGSALDLLSVAGSSLSATAAVTPSEGTVTTVTSIARGVSLLGGALRIGQVTTSATARAHGRPGTAAGSFTRVVRDVTLDGKRLCGANCDPEAVAEQVNSALAGRLLITFPTPDPKLARGSPGGYQTLVRRNVYSQANEQIVNDQPADRVEVPGLEATVFEDSQAPAHTVIYLAGVEAEADYGIYLLGQPGGQSGAAPSPNPAGPGPRTPGGTTPVTPGLPNPQQSVPPPGPGTPPTVAAPTGVAGLLHHGWQLLVAGLGDAVRLFGVWLVLLAPIYLSARRWLLTRRHDVARV